MAVPSPPQTELKSKTPANSVISKCMLRDECDRLTLLPTEHILNTSLLQFSLKTDQRKPQVWVVLVFPLIIHVSVTSCALEPCFCVCALAIQAILFHFKVQVCSTLIHKKTLMFI